MSASSSRDEEEEGDEDDGEEGDEDDGDCVTSDRFLALSPSDRAAWWGQTPADDAGKHALSCVAVSAAMGGDSSLQHAIGEAQRESAAMVVSRTDGE
jgi:hypothetical protein